MKTSTKISYFFILSAVVAVSCNTRSKSGSDVSSDLNDQFVNKEKAVEAVIGYPIPTSFEVVKMLNDAGAPFIFGINNPPENVKNYVSIKERAVNLGIYGADLSYASTYNMKQETMDFLNASKELIDELQIAGTFNKDLAKRVEANLENKDSLISIITNSFYDTYAYLRKNNQDVSSVLVVAGSWIESVYLTSQIIITSNDKEPFNTILINQKNSLGQLLSVMEPVKEDSSIAPIYAKLLEINATYSQMGDSANNEEIESLTTQVEELRGSLV